MTFLQKIIEDLVKCGMFPDQAEAVAERLQEDPVSESMKGRWNQDTSEYPPMVYNVVWVSAKQVALGWIDENCPAAWFRTVFV